MSDTVLYDHADAVATITLNRPDALNALNRETKESLIEALGRARDDGAVRAVLLTGTGRAFCVGQDLREHAGALKEGVGLDDTVRAHYNPIVLAIAEMPKPVVAALNGMAAGAGASMALACDLRVAADTAGLLMAFANIGLAADSGASWLLPRLVGRARATELLMLAEPVSAERALELGLVSSVVPAEALSGMSRELAARLASGPTVAYRFIKSELDYAETHGLAETLDHEADAQAACGRTADHRDATLAFLGKRGPTFEGR